MTDFATGAFSANLMSGLSTPPAPPTQAIGSFAKHLLTDWLVSKGGMRNGNAFLIIETASNGSFSGTVSVNSVLVADATVKIYSQTSGELVAVTKTDKAGAYTITGLSPNAVYLMVADDPASSENSGVYAREVPA